MTGSPLSGCQSLAPLAFVPGGCLLVALPWGIAEVMLSWLENLALFSPEMGLNVYTGAGPPM